MKIRRLSIALALFFLSHLPACQPSEEPAPEPAAAIRSAAAPVVEVTAVEYAFEAPDEIPSGWTTFRLENRGREEHFLFLGRLPDGVSFEQYGREVGAAFEAAYDSLRAETVDKAGAGALLGRRLPEWYLTSYQVFGGPGLLAPGRTARATVELEPGRYVMECYVKTPDGRFHSALGMVRPLVVTEGPGGGAPPPADVELRVSNAGIQAPAEIAAGERTFAVHYDEHPEVGLGNDVHLARLEEGVSAQAVARWTDWMELEGLRAPAPAEFVGGAHELPAGRTGYFTADLEPGRYVFVIEGPAENARAREVTIGAR